MLFLWRGEELLGFHWTKWHGHGTGEVYVIGLATAAQGAGLAGPLLRDGLRRQTERGARRVILYVEADNARAVALYRKMGFTRAEEHVVYGLIGREE